MAGIKPHSSSAADNNGLLKLCMKAAVISDLLKSKATKGDSSTSVPFASCIGTRSSWNDLLNTEPIKLPTLSIVSAVHEARVGITVHATSDITQRHSSSRCSK